MAFLPCDGCTDGTLRVNRRDSEGAWVYKSVDCPKCLGTMQMKKRDQSEPGAIYVHNSQADTLSMEEIYDRIFNQ